MSKVLEGHARAIVKSLEFPEGTTPMRIDHVTARAVLLHELSLEPSEAVIAAVASIYTGRTPEVLLKWSQETHEGPCTGDPHPCSRCYADKHLDDAKAALQSLRDARRQEIKE